MIPKKFRNLTLWNELLCSYFLQKLSHFKVHRPIKSHDTDQNLARTTTKMIELSSKS